MRIESQILKSPEQLSKLRFTSSSQVAQGVTFMNGNLITFPFFFAASSDSKEERERIRLLNDKEQFGREEK
jgi:hypothetical protein